MTPRVLLLLLALIPAAFAQSPGTVALSGPSTGGRQITPATLNAAVNAALAKKADTASPTFTGTLTAPSVAITGGTISGADVSGANVTPSDTGTPASLATAIGARLPLSGGTLTGALTVPGVTNTGSETVAGTLVANGSTTSPGSPSLGVCPIANCPSPLVRTGNLLQGVTTLGSTVPEWEAVDGLYVNTGQPNGQKVTRYIGAVQGPLGGSTWAGNSDVVRNGIPNGPNGQVGSSSPGTPGAIPIANSTIGWEFDYTNWDQDCGAGGCFSVDLYVHNQSRYASLAGIYYDSAPQNANNFAWHDGLFFSGAYTVKDNTILDATNSTNSVTIQGAHTTAISTTGATITGAALATAPGQKICLDALNSCTSYSAGAFTVGSSSGATIETIDDSGNAVISGSVIAKAYAYSVPASGGTVTVANTTTDVILNPAATLASLTVALPAAPTDGQTVRIATTQAITALTLSSASGIVGNIGSMAAATTATFKFIGSGSLWLRIDRPA